MAAPPFTFDAELAQYCIFDVAGIHMHIHHDAFSAGVSEMRERISAWQGMELAAAAADIAMVHSANDYQFRFARHLTLCSGGCSCTTVSTNPSFDAVEAGVSADGCARAALTPASTPSLYVMVFITHRRSAWRLSACGQTQNASGSGRCGLKSACLLASKYRATSCLRVI